MDEPVFFFEKRFYMFSNFSAFSVEWKGVLWMTVEHAYQAAKFDDQSIIQAIREAHSPYDAKRIAHEHEDKMDKSFFQKKVAIMKSLVEAKVDQHIYVRESLVNTGDREIIEDSPEDTFWGWGQDKSGQNMLGKIWVEIREELKYKKMK